MAASAFFGVSTVLMAGLWLNGRRWRARRAMSPVQIGHIPTTGEHNEKVFVFFDGAFNLASEHAGEMMKAMSSRGDVVYVDYDFDYYDHSRVLCDVRNFLLMSHYKQVCVVGASMGAINGAWLSATLKDHFEHLVFVGNDAALGRQTLPAGSQRRLAPLAKHLAPGLVWNFVLHPLKYLLFRGIPKKHWEDGVGEAAVREHLYFMRRYSFTAVLQMIAAIATATLPSRENLEGVKSIYIRSGHDETLDGDAAEAAWLNLMPDATVLHMETGWHVTYTEQPAGWLEKLRHALNVAYG